MKNSKVTIIIVTYNSGGYIKECLDSVLKTGYQEKEIVVVDNASKDDTRSIWGYYGKKIRVILLAKNTGFSYASNLAIKRTKSKYVFLLNPDTTVDKNFLTPLVRTLNENPKVAACQPAVYLSKKKNVINLTGKNTHYLGFDWIRDYLKSNLPKIGEIASFSGSGVLLRRSMLNSVGYFDDDYFLYYEDTDLSWRMRIFGYRIVFVPQSKIYHDYKYIPVESYYPIKNKLYFNERNRLITILKNYQLSTLVKLLPALIFFEFSILFYSLISGWFPQKIAGYISIIKNLKNIIRKRKVVQKGRRVNDRGIKKEFKSNIDFVYFQIWPAKYLVNPLLNIYWKIIYKFI